MDAGAAQRFMKSDWYPMIFLHRMKPSPLGKHLRMPVTNGGGVDVVNRPAFVDT